MAEVPAVKVPVTAEVTKVEGAVRAFGRSLLSRKFIVTLGVVVPAIAAKQWGVAIGGLLGYLGFEGTADIVTRAKATSTAVTNIVNTVEKAVDQ